MARPENGLSKGFQVQAVLDFDPMWAVAEAMPEQDSQMGGRPRLYPSWVYGVYLCMITVHLSARKTATEIPDVWPLIQEAGRRRYPDDPSMWAPDQPVRRHHWQHIKRVMKNDPDAVDQIVDAFETACAALAPEMGVCDPGGGGSLTYPDLARILVGDGKVVTPLFKAKKGDKWFDKETGEVLAAKKHDPDAKMHTTGGGHPVYGNKFVIWASRIDRCHGRWIHSVGWVKSAGGEARTALDCLTRVAPLLSGAQGALYDGAMRGKHHRECMRLIGLQMISPPAAAKKKTDDNEREEKSSFVESINHPRGTGGLIGIHAYGGAVGVVDYDAAGEPTFVALRRTKTIRRENKSDRTYRWYCDHELPPSLGGGKVTIRMVTDAADLERGINRSENIRIVAPSDPDWQRIYPLRSDIESCNRQLDDTLWLRRAHSVGGTAQLLDLVGYALVYNAVALALTRQQAHAPPVGALAA